MNPGHTKTFCSGPQNYLTPRFSVIGLQWYWLLRFVLKLRPWLIRFRMRLEWAVG